MMIIYTLLAAKNEENWHDAIPVFGISVLGYAQNSNGEKSNKAPKKVCPIPSRLQRWW